MRAGRKTDCSPVKKIVTVRHYEKNILDHDLLKEKNNNKKKKPKHCFPLPESESMRQIKRKTKRGCNVPKKVTTTLKIFDKDKTCPYQIELYTYLI